MTKCGGCIVSNCSRLCRLETRLRDVLLVSFSNALGIVSIAEAESAVGIVIRCIHEVCGELYIRVFISPIIVPG